KQTVTVSLTVGRRPIFQTSDVRNLASFQSGPIAPGEMLSVKGTGFGGPSDLVAGPDPSHRLPIKLGETQVFFDGVPAPLLLAGPATLTIFAPYEIAGKTSTRMTVVFQGNA